jgi:hypothetical protein
MIFTSDATNKKDFVDFFRDLYPKTILTAWPHSNLTISFGVYIFRFGITSEKTRVV